MAMSGRLRQPAVIDDSRLNARAHLQRGHEMDRVETPKFGWLCSGRHATETVVETDQEESPQNLFRVPDGLWVTSFQIGGPRNLHGHHLAGHQFRGPQEAAKSVRFGLAHHQLHYRRGVEVEDTWGLNRHEESRPPLRWSWSRGGPGARAGARSPGAR